MEKALAIIMVAIQKLCGLFDDDEDFDPTWMDAEKWSMTRGI